MSRCVVSIHQPNFFPYEGTLDKLARSDVFVALATAQFSRGNYHNRFQYGGRWQTMGVSQRLEPILYKIYSRPAEDWNKIRSRLWLERELLAPFDEDIGDRLVPTNLKILKRLAAELGHKAAIVADVDTPKWEHLVETSATARLVALCLHYQATEYLSGPGGRNYLDLGMFAKAGIRVVWQEPTAGRPALELLRAAKQ